MDWIVVGLLVLNTILLVFLLIVLSRIASVVLSFLGDGGEGPDLGGIDMEQVLGNLVLQGGTQLLSEAKSQKGGLLGTLKGLFSKKDSADLEKKLDAAANVVPRKPGEMLIDKTGPPTNPIKEMLMGGPDGK